MATSSRQASLFGIQDWQRIYQTYRQADFQSYNYETLRKSFIDYLTTYYPETFNDYIDSSEFIALLDVMAYMGQALAFRDDLNARENFIDTAERRDSVIKLANLVSYTPKRNNAGQGLIKIVAIQTTENLTDINGVSLGGVQVLWNDPANPYWQEQFNSILNAALISSQRVGRPGNTQNILGVKTDEYTISTPAGILPTVPYQSQVDNSSMNFELVSVTSVDSDTLYEIPPKPIGQFNIVFRNDNLGFASPNTGFFAYFKQGTLQNYDFQYLEAIKNNVQNIGNIQGVNETDTWLYSVNPNTNADADFWTKVASVYTNDKLIQTNSTRRVYSVASGFNDQVTYTFGDGIFSEIPVGNFRAYVRSSNALQYTIDPAEMENIQVNLTYVSRLNRQETLTFVISLQTPVNTATNRESIIQIKERAPSRYYTQDRMVNGEDYSNFPFTLYNDIIKSKALNRSSIGVSRNQDLLDPTQKYSSTNVFADDGALYTNADDLNVILSTDSVNTVSSFLNQTLKVILGSPAVLQYYYKDYPRYAGKFTAGDAAQYPVYWHQSTTNSDNVTGYMYYNAPGGGATPISVGVTTSGNMQYISQQSLVKFVPPAIAINGVTYTCFDQNNRLKSGTYDPTLGDKLFIWASPLGVVGDGYNGGLGNFADGSGPVILSEFVPTWAQIATVGGIIPSWDDSVQGELLRTMLQYINVKYDFAIAFDNSINASLNRWKLVYPILTTENSNTYWAVKFTHQQDGTYLVTYHANNYYFGSISQCRFYFDGESNIFDARAGTVISDYVNVLKINTVVGTSTPIGSDNILTIVGQDVESDGFVDDFQVEVSSIDNRTKVSVNPDFFTTIAGVDNYVFFKLVTDANNLPRQQLLPTGAVVTFGTQPLALANVYSYPVGQVFYVTNASIDPYTAPQFFYSVKSDAGILSLVELVNEYARAEGRGGLSFQYRHNSGDTTRIDPATTNIIDLYLVTQAYYTEYQNWINDTTGTVPKPTPPTIDYLSQSYPLIYRYKMLSDSVILNSVQFKPLFGSKADINLQGMIKVIKSTSTTASDSQIRSAVITAMNTYFDIDNWDFGDTFYFSELSAYLHQQLGDLVSSIVLVPKNPNQTFGDLYEILSFPYQIFVNGANVNDVVVIPALTSSQLQR